MHKDLIEQLQKIIPDPKSIPIWKEEFTSTKNTKEALISRLLFHGGLVVEQVVENTGISYQTIRKYFNRFLSDGYVELSTEFHEHYKTKDLLRNHFPHLVPK